MKIITLLGDGMADIKCPELGGKSPLQAAHTPNMDFMAVNGQVGMAKTVPDGMPPGSDVANLSVFGYDPSTCYTGRSPLEAISMGVALGPADVAFRMNLVTLGQRDGEAVMEDFSSGHISSEEGRQIVETLQRELGSSEFEFHAGVSYRHLMVWRGGKDGMSVTPPHDITGRPVSSYLPTGDGAEVLLNIMDRAAELLKGHPVNRAREAAGKKQTTSVWLWGHGKVPGMVSYRERFGLSGAVISAVDLIKGIGLCAGLDSISVEGATGYIDTNYVGKAQAALKALEDHDFVYVHVEAPDEAAHAGRMDHKLQAIEDFDRLVVGTVLEGMKKYDKYAVLCAPDHPTPVSLMTHTAAPVPFVIYRGGVGTGNGANSYDEEQAAATGVVVEGHQLMEMMLV